jgi:hypothetical protein
LPYYCCSTMRCLRSARFAFLSLWRSF